MINLYKVRLSFISIPQLFKKEKFKDRPDTYTIFYTADNLEFKTQDNLTFIVLE